jgi:glycerate dehydrogenase
MKIVILDGYTLNPGDLTWKGFEEMGEVTLYDRTPVDQPNTIIERIGKAEIVITNKTPISRQTLDACHQIKFIGELATGYNNVDIEAAKEKNIPVCNIPTYGTAAVGQFAIALLLEICHHIGHHDRVVHEGKWESCPDFCFWDYPLIELAGKTMGIIGLGRIGKTTGRIAKALGMNVIANDIVESDEGRAIAAYVTLDKLLAESDVVSIHCPLFPSTQGMINRETIAKMKNGVIFLNNSRGPLVVEQDLADALNSGKVFAAGLDVVSSEPIKGNNVLLKAKNCFITPHISWAAKASRQRLMDIAVDNLKAYLAGKPINVVNP